MTAAGGIVHQEFHSQRFTDEGGTLEMVQLWVNLPASAKSAPPKYQDLRDAQFPRIELPDSAGTVRVIAGQLFEAKGPASTFTPINVWDAQYSAGSKVELPIPAGHTALLVVQSGQLTIHDELLSPVEMALLDQQGDTITIDVKQTSRVLVLTGEPLREPVVGQGPFVMNTTDEIRQAFLDYRQGKMGTTH